MKRRITDVKPEDFVNEYRNESINNILIDVQKELYVLRQIVEKIKGEKSGKEKE